MDRTSSFVTFQARLRYGNFSKRYFIWNCAKWLQLFHQMDQLFPRLWSWTKLSNKTEQLWISKTSRACSHGLKVVICESLTLTHCFWSHELSYQVQTSFMLSAFRLAWRHVLKILWSFILSLVNRSNTCKSVIPKIENLQIGGCSYRIER